MSALRELLCVFGIEVDDKAIHEAEKGIDSFTEKLKTVGEAVAEGFGLKKIQEFFEATVDGAAHVQDLAERLGLGADTLRVFGAVAKEAGLDLDSSAHALGFMNRTIGEAVSGGGEAAQAFTKLGVNVKDASGAVRPLDVILGDVAEGMTKLPSQAERAAVSMKIFGREGQTLLPLLSKGRDGFQEMADSAREFDSGLGVEFYERAKKARGEMEKWGLGLKAIKERITAAALPAIVGFAKGLQRLIKPVIEFTKDTERMKRILEILSVGAGVKATQTLLKLAKTLGFLKPSIGETIAALLEFALPLLLVAGLGLAIEDLWTAIQGGDSVIGDFLNQLYGTEKAKVILGDLQKSFEDLKPIWGELKELGPLVFEGMIKSIPVLGRVLVGLVGTFVVLFDSLMAAAKGLKELGLAFTSTNLEETAKHWHLAVAKAGEDSEKTMRMVDLVGDTLVDRDKAFGNLINGGSRKTEDYGLKQSYGTPINVPLPSNMPGQSVIVNQSNTITTNVSGKDGAKEIGSAVGQGVATEVQKANYNALQAVQVP